MTRLQELMGFIQYLDSDLSVSKFEDRKRFQKLVYISQEMGISLDYNYGWYHYGPYSTELADDGFTAFSIPRNKWNEYATPSDMNKHQERINNLKHMIEEINENLNNLNQADALELLASLLFLRRRAYPSIEKKKDAIKKLTQCKSFKESDAKTAWKLLKQFQLV